MSIRPALDAAHHLRRTHPKASALEVLEIVFRERPLTSRDIAQLTDPEALVPADRTLIAAAFDRGMTEAEWEAWQRPPADPKLSAALKTVFIEHVLPMFLTRYASAAANV